MLEVAAHLRGIQDQITTALSAFEPNLAFIEEEWQRPGGGGGRSRSLEDGATFERAGVNFSEVFGELPAELAATMPGSGRGFHAVGTSLVLHPRNPLAPTVHANFRYLEHGDAGWFGGGSDLTPYYLFEEDARHFHQTWKTVCDRHDPGCYARFKKTCDDYFNLPHRGERRGIGGLFFDYLKDDLPERFALVRDLSSVFLDAYVPILEKRRALPFEPLHREWQLLRRGRYVEFNLVYDRGTLFGLKTDGRAESILMSLPPLVAWKAGREPAPGSEEARLLDVLRKPRDWA
jgi:coproporphyrinogen III oxidase